MKYSIKIIAVLSGLLLNCLIVNAQANPVGLKFDEARLALWPGTSVVSDPTAEGGSSNIQACLSRKQCYMVWPL